MHLKTDTIWVIVNIDVNNVITFKKTKLRLALWNIR